MPPTEHYVRHDNVRTRQAKQFLLALLSAGPQPFSLIKQQAGEQGIALSSLLAAKLRLNVKSRTVDRRTVWQLLV